MNQVNISFENLSYSVRVNPFSKKKKEVLSNLDGKFQAGNLNAIMGPSGSGKSTLMNILAGFTTSNVKGNIFVNGQYRNLAVFRSSSVYIMQENNLQPLLTVLEAMYFAADLKLKSSCDSRRKVLAILKELGLDSVHDTMTTNLSGGQKKRLAIAQELIGNPGIIFLDEPTSGLDSVAARQCFELLQSIAQEGRTVVFIVHQPSAILFEMISHLYVLGKGHCVYSGSPRNVMNFLADFGFFCPPYHNPADYLLEVVSGEYGDQTTKLVDALREKQRHCSQYSLTTNVAVYENLNSSCNCSSFKEIRSLIKCNLIKFSRDRILTYLRLSVSFLIAFLSGLVYYNIGQDAAYALDNFKMIFYTVLYLTFLSMNTTLVAFPLELPVLGREYFNRWYKLHSYYLANRITDLPVQLFASTGYLVIIYCMSGQLMEWQRLWMFLLTSLLVSLVAQIVGLIIGGFFNIQTAAVLGPIALVPTLIFSGFFVNQDHAHPYLRWLFHLSFCKYGFDGVMYATYGLDRPRMQCSANYCHLASSKVILKEFGATHLDYWFAVMVLSGLYIFLNFIAYLALLIKLKIQKR